MDPGARDLDRERAGRLLIAANRDPVQTQIAGLTDHLPAPGEVHL